jgi:hypothetical protein
MDIHGESVFGMRGEDQNIRLFYNVCRHRGHSLVAGSKEFQSCVTCNAYISRIVESGILVSTVSGVWPMNNTRVI